MNREAGSMKKWLIRLLIVLAVLCAVAAFWVHQNPKPEPEPPAPVVTVPEPEEEAPGEDEPQEEPPEALEDDGLPHDKLFITVERQKYQDGDLTLIIPKLEKTLPVYNGVTNEDLKKGVGLYDYAQLPGEGNRNVSIAGHRNTVVAGVISDNAPFYYVDTLEEGDYLYLRDDAHVYRYLYKDTTVVEPDDWGPIYSQGFSCLTLTTCEPIGPGTHRMIVRAELDEIFDVAADADYEYSAQEQSEDEISSVS